MNHAEKATQVFNEKFNCSQAVLASFAEEYNLSEKDAQRVALCLSGGMRKGEVCGAASGALLVLGLKYGESDEGRAIGYDKAAQFMERFKQVNSSYMCRDILGCDISTPEGMDMASKANKFKTVCPKMVESAVKILEEILD